MSARRVVTSFVLAVLVLLGWVLLAPQQLGGPVAVVSTYGDSMLPTYTASDLIVVVEAGNYDVGDIVAYQSEALDTVVLHRIVDIDDEGYVTSGDNNDWLDPDRPTDDEIMGTARLRVPGIGRLLEVPGPLRAAAVTGLAALALFGSRRRGRRDRGRRRAGTGGALAFRGHGRTAPDERLSEGGDPVASDTARSSLAWTGWPGTVAAVGGALALAGAALGAVALTTPSVAPGEVSYTHEGTFDYTTPAPGGLVYPDGEVASGDPVFLRLVETLDLTFTHELDAPTQGVHTVGRLWLELADGSGWSHRTPLSDEQEATDEPLVLGAPLDVPAVRELIEEIREEAGVEGTGGRIDVTAEVEVTAAVEGEELSDTFFSTLGFELSEQRLVPQVNDDEGDALTTTQEGTVTVEGAEPARLEVAGRGLAVAEARVLAAAALVAGLLAVVVGLTGALRHRGLDEAERLRLRYGSRLVEVGSLRAPANHGLVTVRDMPTLVALAEQAERPILHHEQDGLHTYVVEDETTQYHYRVEVPPPTPSAADESDEDAGQVTGSAPTDEGAVPAPEPRLQPGPGPRPGPIPDPEPEPGPLPEPEPDPQPSPVPEPDPRPGPIPDPEPDPQPEPQFEADAWWDEIDDAQVPSDEPLFSSGTPAANRPDSAARDVGPWVARPPRRSAAPAAPPPGASGHEGTAARDESAASERRNRPRARRSKRFGENGPLRRRDSEPPANGNPDSP